ncbi:MAG TPA: nicotinate-nucleotide adenylyltransferase [Terrimicrobiaceae bacterium]|nr:nicotinate-nucleotide adenylyltransferase [Terrimicrobiaceae bacterium]
MTPTPEKIGLYGGSFDPIHHGHLILARDAMERLELDRVVFLPARISPHKLDRPPVPPEVRCDMVAAAIAGEAYFSMDDCEIRREGPSFTIDTVRLYRERFPDAKIYYFIGDDNLPDLDTWKDIEKLQELAQFVVLTRAGMPFLSKFPLIERHVEISSTEIRNRVARGLSVRYMVPVPTCEVINKLGLYRND